MGVSAYASGSKVAGIGTFTVTLASPGLFTKTAHGLAVGDKVVFSTTGALPTGLTAGTTYYVIAAGLTANDFEVSATDGGSAVNTSVSQSGTHSLVAENFLSSPNVVGTFTLHVDANVMQAGDYLELRVYQMVLTGGASRGAYIACYEGVQADADFIKISVPISNELTDTNSLRFSLKQAAGTSRTYPWKVLRYA